MRIGIPRESKIHEYRVAATPAGVRRLVQGGHEVIVQHDAGRRIGFHDEDYRIAGASVAESIDAVFAADMIFKVKEPQPEEIARLREGQVLFAYLHLAAAPELAAALLKRKVVAIAFETVLDAAGHTPLLVPMSQVAGRLSVQVGATALQMEHGGRGMLLSGLPGVPPGRVAILGGGTVGASAARVAVGFGADVTVLDRNPEKLAHFDDLYLGRLKTRYSEPHAIEEEVTRADLVIGAAMVTGHKAPRLLPRPLVAAMQTGSVIVDVAIDQGGIAETSRPTTHQDPTYVEEGVVHYCVANMPGAVARTSTLALEQVTLPHALKLAALGWRQALGQDAGLAAGLNLCLGVVTHPAVAEDLGYEYRPSSAQY
jgi:alanine dehydrogenase